RGEQPALPLIGDEAFEVLTPRLEPADPRGAGDSMMAGIAAGLASGEPVADAIRTGAAAGALNVTRHGLGTGQPEAVAELKQRIRLVPIGRGEATKARTTPEELAERIRRRGPGSWAPTMRGSARMGSGGWPRLPGAPAWRWSSPRRWPSRRAAAPRSSRLSGTAGSRWTTATCPVWTGSPRTRSPHHRRSSRSSRPGARSAPS